MKRKTLLFIFSLGMITLLSCNLNKGNDEDAKNTFFTIPFEEITKNQREEPLSSFAKSAKWIPLENTEEALVSNITAIEVTKDYIFTYCEEAETPVLQFTKDGTFVRAIARQGQGPGELQSYLSFSVNEEKQEVYIATGISEKVYSFEGAYLREETFKTDHLLDAWANDETFVQYNMPYSLEDKFQFVAHSTKKDTIQTLGRTTTYNISTPTAFYYSPYQNLFYRYGNTLHCKSLENDTVYAYKDETFIPCFSIDFGKRKFDYDVIYASEQTQTPSKSCVQAGIYESDNYVLMPYSQPCNIFEDSPLDMNKGCVVYNKQTNEGIAVRERRETGFTNNLTGGPKVLPRFVHENTLYIPVNAVDLKICVESQRFAKQEVEFPEQKAELEILANEMSDNDNSLLLVIELN